MTDQTGSLIIVIILAITLTILGVIMFRSFNYQPIKLIDIQPGGVVKNTWSRRPDVNVGQVHTTIGTSN